MSRALTATQIARAGELLDGALGNVTAVQLDDACERLALADRHERALEGRVSNALVSLLLRQRGFRPAGCRATGATRTMLYVRPTVRRPLFRLGASR